MKIEKLVWNFVMGMIFGFGILIILLDLTGQKEGLLIGLIFIGASMLGVSSTNKIFDTIFED